MGDSGVYFLILVWRKSEAETEACMYVMKAKEHTSLFAVSNYSVKTKINNNYYGCGENKFFSFTIVEGSVKYMHRVSNCIPAVSFPFSRKELRLENQ